MSNIFEFVKNLLLFKEPKQVESFVLKENKTAKENNGQKKDKETASQTENRIKNEGLLLNKHVGIKGKSKHNQNQPQETEKSEISKDIKHNLEYMKDIYTIPKNGDIVLREFDITVKDKVIPAFIIFFDGLTDRKLINDNILQPLMLFSNLDIKGDEKDVAEYIKNHILPHNQLKEKKEYKKIVEEINIGGCGLFIDGIDIAFTADVKGWEHRGVERPNTEMVIRGPQESFNELLRVNTALVRKILKDEDLIVENVEIGKKSKTPCSVMYIKDISNDSLVKEVMRRLKGLEIDHILDSGELEQLIEDSTFLPAPQVIATERPDKVASLLSEGKVAIILNGSPFALVVPATFVGLIHSPEDSYIRFPYANLLRIIRVIGIVFALLLPGLYIAITNFHQEMIPTDLLLAIEASREKVPFPTVVELLIMEISFELIREAGIRIPGPIGPTLGIIGALILGQAAVAANIVSPILIIVVAVAGIGSFAIPNFSLALAFRILRFVYIFLAATVGFLGITLGIFIHSLLLLNAKSFGVPFLSPFAPLSKGVWTDEILKTPIWKQEMRPDFLNTKERKRQHKISRRWTEELKEGDNGDK